MFTMKFEFLLEQLALAAFQAGQKYGRDEAFVALEQTENITTPNFTAWFGSVNFQLKEKK